MMSSESGRCDQVNKSSEGDPRILPFLQSDTALMIIYSRPAKCSFGDE
jgi:hypothetical protein